MKFQVIFTYDSEYLGYVAEVPELPGCVSQGTNLDEAIENIKDAIKGYLHVLEKHGKPYVTKESQSFAQTIPRTRLKIFCCQGVLP
jgi:predicted RNase H-like HicB family nuclease